MTEPLGEPTAVTVHASGSELPATAPRADGGLDADMVLAATGLYREHRAFVWRNARRLGCADDWIDDAVHEIFLVATRRLHEFEGRAQPRTWLFAITFRVVQRMRRDRARRTTAMRRYAEQLPPGAGAVSTDESAAALLRYLLAQLPTAQQLVLILAELEGFTSQEISQTLGVPQGTVHSRLRAAKQQLAALIERENQTHERPEK